jgi:flagellar biosynthesis component FlhA
MNYLDLLPDDVLNIINRKVQEGHITERRIERKRNRKINREQKRVADRMRNMGDKFVLLYQEHLKDKYLKKAKNHFDCNFLTMLIDDIYMCGKGKHEYEYIKALLLFLDEEENNDET